MSCFTDASFCKGRETLGCRDMQWRKTLECEENEGTSQHLAIIPYVAIMPGAGVSRSATSPGLGEVVLI